MLLPCSTVQTVLIRISAGENFQLSSRSDAIVCSEIYHNSHHEKHSLCLYYTEHIFNANCMPVLYSIYQMQFIKCDFVF